MTLKVAVLGFPAGLTVPMVSVDVVVKPVELHVLGCRLTY